MNTSVLDQLRVMDGCFAPSTASAMLTALLGSGEWPVVQAALLGIANHPDKEVVSAILTVLDQQDELPIYGGTYEQSLEDAPDATIREQWRCRFRVKQAACIALGAIGAQFGSQALEPHAVERLMRYAVDQGEDYPVRAASCAALGRARVARATVVLARAAADTEWCTATEAKRALSRLRSPI